MSTAATTAAARPRRFGLGWGRLAWVWRWFTQYRTAFSLYFRELTEQAARKRTYIIRVLYASALFLVSLLFGYDSMRQVANGDLDSLGIGAQVLAIVVGLQFGGLVLFVPALFAGAIAAEKERDTLELTLLTRLTPSGIVAAKFFARLTPVLTFLLLCLPVLAGLYSFGGIASWMIWVSGLALLFTAMQLGAISLFFSAWCPTTARAFIGAYIAGFLLILALPMLEGVGAISHTSGMYGVLTQWMEDRGIIPVRQMSSAMLVGPVLYAMELGSPWSFSAGGPSLITFLLHWVPINLCTLAFLVLTRLVLVRRAKPAGGNAGLKAFRGVDGVFTSLNRRFGRGIEFGRSTDRLPDDKPVAWRETTKTTLGNARYLTRTLLGLLTPILFTVVLLVANNATSSGMEVLIFVSVVYWLLVSLILAVRSAGLFTGERSGQTLEVLLSTPMATRQIVREKLRGVWRLAIVAAIPLLTIAALSAYFQSGGMGAYRSYGRSTGPPGLYLAVTVGCVAVYLPLIVFLGVLCGMVFKTPSRAAIAAVGAVFLVCVATPLLFAFLAEFVGLPEQDVAWLMMGSPAVLIAMNEARELDEFLPRGMASGWQHTVAGTWAAIALALFAVLVAALGLLCFRLAAPLLGRGDRPRWAGATRATGDGGGVG